MPTKYKLQFVLIRIAVFVCTTSVSFAQLIIDTTLTPQQLVQNVLLGSGVTASNIKFTGAHHDTICAIAKFSGSTNINLPGGVIMTTGTTTGKNGPQGPNPSTTAGGSTGIDNGEPGDSLLSSIYSNTSLNAAVLEFDFIPTGDSINFHYVFGSEEYPEYACGTNFNDIFGFFISGPNPLGGNYVSKNIALIPATSLPVSIKSINNAGCSNYSKYYVDNIGGQTIQYDGFTTPLTAIAPVVCGASYHIKLAIADVSDGLFDSGVFLEAGSFSSSNIAVNKALSFNGNDTTIFEGCGHTYVTLKRNANAISKADSVGYALSGTALNGFDFTVTSPSISGPSIVFPVGVDSVRLDFNALQDNSAEALEYFTLTLFIKQCNKVVQNDITIYIANVTPLTVVANNDTTINCPNQPVMLSATANGGINTLGNYVYSWSNGSSGNNVSVNPNATTQYIISVKDTCGTYVATDTVNVFVNYIPVQLNSSGNVEICHGNSAALAVTASLGRPGYTYNWFPTNDTVQNILVTPASTSTYTVSVKDMCNQIFTRTITVRIAETKADFDWGLAHDLQVNFTNTSVEADSAVWFFGDSTFSKEYNPVHIYPDSGTYIVTLIVTNTIGCSDTIQHTLFVLPDLYFYFPNSFTPNSDGYNDVFKGVGHGIKNYSMKIYDRWGNVIFTSNDASVGWDGRTKHGKAEMNSYVCIFDVEDFFGHSFHRMGNIMLIR
ncbi:MAG: choice-of-anchor L domain-containing protein [Bacteroidia bacterium]|nr:choice-of-anchor L domain-containing protein [Bacteroidia bacterium]